MNFSLSASVGGFFKLEVLDASGNKKREVDWFPNLVLDAGLEGMATLEWMAGIHVGSGNSAPSKEQVSLDTFVAQVYGVNNGESQSTGVTDDGLYAYLSKKKGFRFAAGSFNNSTLREIGIAMGSTSTAGKPLWNRALIKDAQGNPTSITLASDEILDVTVEVRVYLELADKTGSFNVLDRDGAVIDTINYIVRPSDINTSLSIIGQYVNRITWDNVRLFSGSITDPTARNPTGSVISSGTSSGSTSLTVLPYVPLSYTSKRRMNTPISNGNGTFKSMQANTILGTWQLGFDKPITKTADQTQTLYYEFSWNRR